MYENVNSKGSFVYNGPERRKYKRIKKQFVARFQVISSELQKGTSSEWRMVTMQNLGAEGALFNYDKKITIGSLLNLKIGFPASTGPINCVGKVIRVKQKPNASLFRIATLFTDIGKLEKELIAKTAERLYTKKPERIES